MDMSWTSRVNTDTPLPIQVQQFSPTHWQRLQEIRFKKRLFAVPGHIPLVTVCFAFTASLVLLAGIFVVPEAPLVKELGGVFLLLTVPLLIGEIMFKSLVVRLRLAALYPYVADVRDIQRVLGDYLADLDRRTSRFFHVVTNTKVTTYFMLRQIESVLGERAELLSQLLKTPSLRSLEEALEMLQGMVEYRDGFVFNQGRAYQVPTAQIAVRVQELVGDLERGIAEIEQEIRMYRDQAAPEEQELNAPNLLAPPEKQ